jgi:inner membrane protein
MGGSFRPLLAISALAILTHPFLDWLNNYGMRWLMPFDGTWFYGDSVFIMDPWLWLILGFGFLAGRKRRPATIVAFVVVTMLLAWVVARRSPSYLIVVGVVAVVLLVAMFWKTTPKAGLAIALASVYIAGRLIIHYVAAYDVRRQIASPVQKLMVSPHPIDPTRWEVVAQIGDVYRYGGYRRGQLTLADDRLPVAKPSPEYDEARRDPSIRGFLTWARFPWYEVIREGGQTRVLIHDARYAVRRRAGGWGGVEVKLTDKSTGRERALP